jgi:hypothetical protein
MPPDQVLVLAGDEGLADPARLQAALQPRGFSLKQVGGVPVWHRFDDFKVNPRERNLADPFGGELGRAARIAVLPQMLVSAASWPTLEAVLAARDAEREGAVALPTMLRAAVAAVEDYGGDGALLVQAVALPLAAVVETPPVPGLMGNPDDAAAWAEELQAKLAAPASGPVLPPFPVVVLADLQLGDEQVSVIALPYAGRETAEAAAEIVADRLHAWAIPGREAKGTVVSGVGGTIETATAAADAMTVALVAVRHSAGEAAADDEEQQGVVFHTWMRSIYRREFSPLALVN